MDVRTANTALVHFLSLCEPHPHAAVVRAQLSADPLSPGPLLAVQRYMNTAAVQRALSDIDDAALPVMFLTPTAEGPGPGIDLASVCASTKNDQHHCGVWLLSLYRLCIAVQPDAVQKFAEQMAHIETTARIETTTAVAPRGSPIVGDLNQMVTALSQHLPGIVQSITNGGDVESALRQIMPTGGDASAVTDIVGALRSLTEPADASATDNAAVADSVGRVMGLCGLAAPTQSVDAIAAAGRWFAANAGDALAQISTQHLPSLPLEPPVALAPIVQAAEMAGPRVAGQLWCALYELHSVCNPTSTAFEQQIEHVRNAIAAASTGTTTATGTAINTLLGSLGVDQGFAGTLGSLVATIPEIFETLRKGDTTLALQNLEDTLCLALPDAHRPGRRAAIRSVLAAAQRMVE